MHRSLKEAVSTPPKKIWDEVSVAPDPPVHNRSEQRTPPNLPTETKEGKELNYKERKVDGNKIKQ